MVGNTEPGVLDVEDDDDDIKYGEPAPVSAPPGPFTTTTGRSGVWSTTSLTAHAEPTRDMIEIYSDVEAPKSSAFSTSPLNEGDDVGPTGTDKVIDGTEKVVGWVNIMNADVDDDGHSRIAAAGAFPRVIGDAEPFKLVDKGLTEMQYDALDPDNDGTFSGIDANTDGTVTDEELESVTDYGITRQQYNQYRGGQGLSDPDEFQPGTPIQHADRCREQTAGIAAPVHPRQRPVPCRTEGVVRVRWRRQRLGLHSIERDGGRSLSRMLSTCGSGCGLGRL